jgi:hypothetical protein
VGGFFYGRKVLLSDNISNAPRRVQQPSTAGGYNRFDRFMGFIHILGYAVENKHLYYIH